MYQSWFKRIITQLQVNPYWIKCLNKHYSAHPGSACISRDVQYVYFQLIISIGFINNNGTCVIDCNEFVMFRNYIQPLCEVLKFFFVFVFLTIRGDPLMVLHNCSYVTILTKLLEVLNYNTSFQKMFYPSTFSKD